MKMSFNGRTPEALLPRTDSKNPATTCRGITSTGRPCRRGLAASPKNSPTSSPSRGAGVLAVLEQQNAAAFYCWQHKDQAEQLAAKAYQKTTLQPLKEKSSIDTLVEQVGILDLDEDVPSQPRRHRRRHETERRRDTLPSGWNQMESPLMRVPEEMVYRQSRPQRHRSPSRSNVGFSWACCIQADDDDIPSRSNQERPPPPLQPSITRLEPIHTAPRYTSPMQMTSARPEARQLPATLAHNDNPGSPARSRPRPSPTPSSKSQTQTLLSHIPSHLSPQTTSQLLAELSRPISAADDAGYIYIFWLTPESEASKPDDETASSLLDDEDDLYTSPRSQRTNQALTRYASVPHPPNRRTQRTITLKIGRAANVHRRMTQWTKQCGQNITLIRYYPHQNGTSSSSVSGKVPHVNRVERLVHLELAEKRIVKSECERCGREHREWFEIEASRAGLRSVDEVIRRWVAWAALQ